MRFVFLVVFFLPVSNYPFLTPRKKDSEFRIQPSAWMQNAGVRNG